MRTPSYSPILLQTSADNTANVCEQMSVSNLSASFCLRQQIYIYIRSAFRSFCIREVFERQFEHLRVCPKTIPYGPYGYNDMGVLVIINEKFIENVTNVVFWHGKRIDCKIWSFFLVSSVPNSICEPTITVYYVRDDM